MSIQEIKAALTIEQVLGHYGLKANSRGMLNCPFHKDRKASMKVYTETNTVYCFAGGCIGSVDVIDFIMKKESISKHAAILKAQVLCNAPLKVSTVSKISTTPMSQDKPSLSERFSSYQSSLKRNTKAQAYCDSRSLDWQALTIGYKSQKTAEKWGRGCIIFPLHNRKGEVISLYGRSIVNGNHYYSSGRSGLYPAYPPSNTKRIILTECIIDAASLQQQKEVAKEHSILALYGTNGLTKEHIKVLQSLKHLEEITFFLDGDSAGQEAVKAYTQQLKELLPRVRLMNIVPLENEDINSILQAHDPSILVDMVAQRKAMSPKKASVVKSLIANPHPVTRNPLNSNNPHNLIYTTAQAIYSVKGGIRCTAKDLDSLRVSLSVSKKENGGIKSRIKIDLYEDKLLLKSAAWIAEQLGLSQDLIVLDLHALTDRLEVYRQECYQLAQARSNTPNKVSIPQSIQKEATSFWKKKRLMKRIDQQLQEAGIIGEQNNRRLGFCIVSSYGMSTPLHGLIQGTSGSGKTWLLTTLCALVPPENYIPITRATDNSFYNYGPYDLKNKLISIEDKDAMSEEASLAFRELQSKGMVSTSTTGQDDTGNNRSFIKKVYGPVASIACTTKGELYLDDMNRCFLLAVDESKTQTTNILAYQKQQAAGLVDVDKMQSVQYFMQHLLRLLQSYRVVIPYATQIHLPNHVKDKRRLNNLYLSLVSQLTLLHQYQREKDAQNRLISTIEDLQLANEIMFDAIVLKADELHGSLRSFYEKLKIWLASQTGQAAGEQAQEREFRQRELRQALHLSKTAVSNYLRELVALEYVQITGGSERRGWQYKIQYWDDNKLLRQQIKSFLAAQIKELKQAQKATNP